MHIISILIFLSLSITALGSEKLGEITITGHGIALAKPDFVQMSVTVTSLCYETSKQAKDANAILANSILRLMKKYTHRREDQVTAIGGRNVLKTEFTDSGNRRVVLCKRKWRSTNELKVKISDMERIPDLQDDIIMVIDDTVDVRNDSKKSFTYAELSDPKFDLFDMTRKELRNKSQRIAYSDAMGQYQNFSSMCPFDQGKLMKIGQPSFSVSPVYKSNSLADISTPIVPDVISIASTWEFQWNFVPMKGCP